jgi:predicted RNA-binding Zn-ribbon protein involved in translation (DUF1610 family)
MAEKVEADLQPEEVAFECPDCGLSCVLHPRAQPMNVQHQIPEKCFTWRKIENVKGDEKQEMLLEFLRRADIRVVGGGKFFA